MKKLIVAILSVLYLGTSAGATIHMHYCCGELDGITFSGGHKYKCGTDSRTIVSKKSCCDDRQLQVKTDGEQNKAEITQILNAPFSSVAILQQQTIVIAHYPNAILQKLFANPPPLLESSVPTYLRNCVFRI